MKDLFTNFVLIFVCCAIGIGGGALIGEYVNDLSESNGLPEGSQFESIDDLRKQISQRDSRDVKPDQSLSLRSIIQAHDSDNIIYELIPNLDVKFQGVNVKTNSFGMRNREVAFEKPADVYRIALLGDSFAFGWGVEEEKIFARVLEKELAKKTGRKVEVLNFGVPGYSSFQEVEKFKVFGSKFKPDAVLVYFVDNDFFLPFFIKSFDEGSSLKTARDFDSFRNHENKEVRNKSRTWLNSIDANRSLVRLSKMSEEQGFELFLTINPRRAWKKDKQRLWVLKQRKNFKYIDLRTPFIEHIKANNIDPKTLQLKGDPHPNAKKHALFGKYLADSIYDQSNFFK